MTVPILMYHSIGNDCSAGYRRWMVTPDRLESQLRAVRSLGYRFVTIRELAHIRRNGGLYGHRLAVVTFDDGLADFLSGAVPVLERLGVPATLFVTTGYVGETARWLAGLGEGDRPMLAKSDIQALARSGIECGAHSHTHPQLDLLDPAAASREVLTSRDLLGDWLGSMPRSFAYPHGYYTQAVREIVAQAGFSSACRVAHALSRREEDPYALARIIMTERIDQPALERMLRGQEIGYAPPSDSLPIRAWRLVRRIQGLARPAAYLPLLLCTHPHAHTFADLISAV
ncbi:polysaccharide deacetylase family protein [Pelagibacterium sp. H642]|uniref:polysaccharide deacetylase family protein n=1 Tax=Pelagibacterium sp. H642 TaxID=1881069 RepID=UPI002815E93E|nr:polysaccharide deacetylase family protein [Pelagibacterium sp. H642]WMT91289.1 polysaccharide deacetylase family protein [Pelagibacterium sp. H642]